MPPRIPLLCNGASKAAFHICLGAALPLQGLQAHFPPSSRLHTAAPLTAQEFTRLWIGAAYRAIVQDSQN